jgi:CheY-like chemotaxis protein
MRERHAGQDAHGAGNAGMPFHEIAPVASTDQFLASGDKLPPRHRTYKAHPFTREPDGLRMELTSNVRDRTSDHARMEQQRRTIAVIDDDHSIRSALERMLGIAGFRVLTFASAEAFLTSPHQGEAGCAIVDIELGTTTGLDLAGHPSVKEAQLPIVFISGTADDSVRARAMALGCIEYLRKPFMPIELLDAVFRATQESPPIP